MKAKILTIVLLVVGTILALTGFALCFVNGLTNLRVAGIYIGGLGGSMLIGTGIVLYRSGKIFKKKNKKEKE